jgi:hypothetical protein
VLSWTAPVSAGAGHITSYAITALDVTSGATLAATNVAGPSGHLRDRDRTRGGGGYLLVGADGGVYAFGDAAFQGSVAGTRLSGAVVGGGGT